MSVMRDRSVVRSSVSPSAKYCWSGSLLRLAKGSTTIDKRGATRGSEIDAAAAISGAAAGFVVGQSDHALAPRTSTVPAAAAIAMLATRRRRGAATGMLDTGESAMASGGIGETTDGASAPACVTAAAKR